MGQDSKVDKGYRITFFALVSIEFYISFLDPLLLPFIALHELVRCMLFELMHREVVGGVRRMDKDAACFDTKT